MSFEDSFRRIVGQLPGHEPRAAQDLMAATVDDALQRGRHALIEAGTGCGKSFAYLIPLLLGEGPVVVSTASIALQEQLLLKDLPFLEQAMGRSIPVVLAKGRNHYLCQQKFWELDRILPVTDARRPAFEDLRGRLASWDMDVASLESRIPDDLWSELGQTSEDCLGPRCEFHDRNPMRIQRQRMADAHLIVTNHAFYMADVALGGQLLPPHRAVVFDEAHHLPAVATQAYLATIGRYSQLALLQKIRRRVAPVPEGLARNLIGLEATLFECLLSAAEGGPMPSSPLAAQQQGRTSFRLFPDGRFLDVAEGILEQLGELRHWLKSEPTPDGLLPELASKAPLHRERCRMQLDGLMRRWEHFAREADPGGDRVAWVELDRHRGTFELKSAPLETGSTLARDLWSKRPAILTSATLAVDGDFSYFRRQLAIPDPMELAVASPFDYRRQATLYVPRLLPQPNEPGFAEEARRAIRDILEFSQGRAFVLFTAHRAMRAAFRTLEPDLPFPARQQGDAPRTVLLDWFRQTPHAVLFATSSFWEGVDVPGDALSCVIIDRLPFSVPDDPVVQARVDQLKARGRDWFGEYTLPEAIIRLKQGFGRLIRTGSDRGLVAILDNRLLTKAYGASILKALPDCPTVRDLDEVRSLGIGPA